MPGLPSVLETTIGSAERRTRAWNVAPSGSMTVDDERHERLALLGVADAHRGLEATHAVGLVAEVDVRDVRHDRNGEAHERRDGARELERARERLAHPGQEPQLRLGALERRDVGERHLAGADRVPVVERRELRLDHDRAPLVPDQHRELARRVAPLEEALVEVLPVRFALRCGGELHEGREEAPAELRAIDADHARRGEVHLADPAVAVEREVPHRSQIEQVRVAAPRLLERLLRLAQLAVLHLELDLMHLELVDDLQRLLGFGVRVAERVLERLDELLLRHVLEAAAHASTPFETGKSASNVNKMRTDSLGIGSMRLPLTCTVRVTPPENL
jgi:hypothetical protein